MKFGPIEMTDKKGRTIVLRNADVSDADALIEYLKITAGETSYLLREPDEVSMTTAQEVDFIKNYIDAERELMLIATIDGKHIGNCTLMKIGSFKRLTHRCEIAIALYKEYFGAGIGEMMLRTVLDVAKEVGYKQVELEVVSENTRATVSETHFPTTLILS